ncbi:MAG: hypothetical protein AB8B49_08545, partial [Nitratireductor sp.]
MFRILSIAFSIYALLAASIAAFVYYDALKNAFENDRELGKVRLSEASSRLRGQLDVYKAIVNIVANDPKIAEHINNINAQERAKAFGEDVTTDLSLLQLTYGAWEIDLVDLNRKVIASSDKAHIGYSYSNKLMQPAINGRLGFTIEIENDQRLVRFSRRVSRSTDSLGNTVLVDKTNSEANAIGAVVVSANLEALEFQWPVTPEPIVFFNEKNQTISANRLELLMLSQGNATRANYPVT